MSELVLGAEFGRKKGGTDWGPLAPMHDEIINEVTSLLAPLTNALRTLRSPNVTVQAPPPASVTVTPTINVDAPDMDDVQIVLPGMDRLEAGMTSIATKLDALLTEAKKPVVRTVERDGNGLITKITEKRG